ncbi:hypothetical protein RyT2_11360 [Pseudolactococcus yaeyamensis]
MVVFNKNNDIVPIDFGEFKFEFSASDENVKRLMKVSEELSKKVDLDNLTEDSAFEKAKEILKKSWDGLFGEEAFEKVYAFSGASTISTASYLIQTIEGIFKEAQQFRSQATFDKYLNK